MQANTFVYTLIISGLLAFGDSQPPDVPRQPGNELVLSVSDQSAPKTDRQVSFSDSKNSESYITADDPPKEITNSIGMRFKWIMPGEFTMGSPEDETDRGSGENQHAVIISKPFYLGVYEVTQEEYTQVMGKNPSRFRGAARPVENVTWQEAMEFCATLSAKESRKYRLPTEAEWEYACRAGTTSRFSFGDSEAELHLYGNYCDASNTDRLQGQDKDHSDGHDKTAPVGSYRPNQFGLYDMHGNVCEWCLDWYNLDYHSTLPDPKGPSDGTFRVYRGGGWSHGPRFCRSASRLRIGPAYKIYDLGFRVVRIPDGQGE